jgi:hypothetical protein
VTGVTGWVTAPVTPVCPAQVLGDRGDRSKKEFCSRKISTGTGLGLSGSAANNVDLTCHPCHPRADQGKQVTPSPVTPLSPLSPRAGRALSWLVLGLDLVASMMPALLFISFVIYTAWAAWWI